MNFVVVDRSLGFYDGARFLRALDEQRQTGGRLFVSSLVRERRLSTRITTG
jgi:hypothetical protein